MTLSLSWSTVLGHPTLLVRGLPPHLLALPLPDLAHRLSLFPSDLLPGHLPHSDGAGNDGLAPLQPLAGEFSIHGDELHFTPRFPFLDGLSYSVVLRTASEQQLAHLRRPAAPVTPTTTVLEIYPTCQEIPVNLLRLYIHFSNPISDGHALKHVHVHSASRNRLHDVFLNMDPELWDPTHTRLTMLLDPGRIKRGLVPNREAGYPLTEGDRITISIDSSYPDAHGRPLLGAATRTYQVGPHLRSHVNPTLWRLAIPPVNTLEPLMVSFDRPLDHALLQHAFTVHHLDSQEPLTGTLNIEPGEISCSFIPNSPWAPGPHQLHIDPRLEDLAGNNLQRLFDRDLSNPHDTPSVATLFSLSFVCP